MSLAKILAAPALLAALAAATPAIAAPNDGNALRRDIAQLDRKVDKLEKRRAISGREAVTFDRRVSALNQTWRAYSRGGFSQSERRNLSAQILRVERDLDRQAYAHNNRNNRNDRYDRNDRRNDRYAYRR